MNHISRKRFLQMAAGAGTTAALGPFVSLGAAPRARVLVIGGGFSGATCAGYIRRFDPSIEVTLVEPQTSYYTCPMSNAVLGGLKKMEFIKQNYDGLRSIGVKVVHDMVSAVDPAGKKATLKSGKTLAFDKLVVAPGIDFVWNGVDGYSQAASATVPHSWQAGPQTVLLRKQLEAMPDGGTVIIAPPGNPFRCPPGPYERASMIAHYLKNNKPKSKILILDAKNKFSKQGLFMAGWKRFYPGMIEWVAGAKGGKIAEIDVKTKTITTETGGKHKGAVINLIPPQKAGQVAFQAGLTKGNWCPVNQKTFESEIHKDIHVIGDSSIAGKMPKSGFAANSQGKVCAAAVVSSLQGKTMPDPSYANTCYSLVTPDYGISVAKVYRYGAKGSIVGVKGSGGVGPKKVNDAFRKEEASYAFGWYANITSDTWAY